ncbi:MAG: FecR domain-containing protein [Candidatus Moduliflexus flocculans]|nr:FecR domain-containing protein [Candidatus Moduliflexus flocculans]
MARDNQGIQGMRTTMKRTTTTLAYCTDCDWTLVNRGVLRRQDHPGLQPRLPRPAPRRPRLPPARPARPARRIQAPRPDPPPARPGTPAAQRSRNTRGTRPGRLGPGRPGTRIPGNAAETRRARLRRRQRDDTPRRRRRRERRHRLDCPRLRRAGHRAKCRAEVDLGAGSAGGASVKLTENTAFYFDTKELSAGQRKTVLQLLSGSLAIKVDKLSNGSFQVGTDQAVLGVRGTVFIVDTIPDGSLLVTRESGAVAVTEGGSTTTAKPGAVVEMTVRRRAKDGLAIEPADLGAWRNGWTDRRLRQLRDQGPGHTPRRMPPRWSRGNRASTPPTPDSKAQAPAPDAWRTARAAGKVPRFTDWIAEKKAVPAALFDCLKALFAPRTPLLPTRSSSRPCTRRAPGSARSRTAARAPTTSAPSRRRTRAWNWAWPGPRGARCCSRGPRRAASRRLLRLQGGEPGNRSVAAGGLNNPARDPGYAVLWGHGAQRRQGFGQAQDR